MDAKTLEKVRRRAVKSAGPTPAPVASPVVEALVATPSLSRLDALTTEQATKVVVGLRVAGYTLNEIAAETGASAAYVRKLLQAQEQKKKQLEELIDGRAVPAAIDNLIVGLEAGDKDFTLETLKGRGLLVKHSHQEGQVPKSAFQFNIVVETPKSGAVEPALGAVVGEPRSLEADSGDRRSHD